VSETDRVRDAAGGPPGSERRRSQYTHHVTAHPDDTPTRPWHTIVASIPEATPVGGLAAVPEPVASKFARYAQNLNRTDETPADVLASLEYEVSEPATRDALDTMRDWRAAQRKEMERLDALDAPDASDDRPWREKLTDNIWVGLPMLAVAVVLLPLRGGRAFDVPVAVSAAASLLAAIRIAFVQTGRATEPPEVRGTLLLPAALALAAPMIVVARVMLAGPSSDFGTVTVIGFGVQVVAALVVVALTVRAEKTRAGPASAEHTPEDAFYEVIEQRIDALYEQVKEQAPLHLRAALAGRDPGIARSSRHTIVDAIRVLHERGEVDSDEAEWMLREALTRQ
jgi:hypothetical protein